MEICSLIILFSRMLFPSLAPRLRVFLLFFYCLLLFFLLPLSLCLLSLLLLFLFVCLLFRFIFSQAIVYFLAKWACLYCGLNFSIKFSTKCNFLSGFTIEVSNLLCFIVICFICPYPVLIFLFLPSMLKRAFCRRGTSIVHMVFYY